MLHSRPCNHESLPIYIILPRLHLSDLTTSYQRICIHCAHFSLRSSHLRMLLSIFTPTPSENCSQGKEWDVRCVVNQLILKNNWFCSFQNSVLIPWLVLSLIITCIKSFIPTLENHKAYWLFNHGCKAAIDLPKLHKYYKHSALFLCLTNNTNCVWFIVFELLYVTAFTLIIEGVMHYFSFHWNLNLASKASLVASVDDKMVTGMAREIFNILINSYLFAIQKHIKIYEVFASLLELFCMPFLFIFSIRQVWNFKNQHFWVYF